MSDPMTVGGRDDVADSQVLEEPAFLDEEGPSAEIPHFISITNARELYGLRDGETVSEAITRVLSNAITVAVVEEARTYSLHESLRGS